MVASVDNVIDLRGRGGAHQPLLIANNLRKRFPVRGGLFNRMRGEVHAVDDVSFFIRKQETLGIVGESGCGKSTLARLLMFLIPLDGGELIFDGDPIGSERGVSLRQLRRNMQMVFQDSSSSLNPRLPIADSIAYGPLVQGTSRSEARKIAGDLLEKVGLRPDLFQSRYPHELSGGQKQRVNIARALALNPRLVIFDEAVSALDKSIEAQVLNLLRHLKAQLNLTYLFISHDLRVVRYISNRVMVMYLGEIVEIGPANSIYETPKHPYTRALLNSQLSMDPGERMDEAPLMGEPPNPINPPTGCRFHDRCPYSDDICTRTTPRLRDVEPNLMATHAVACHMFNANSGFRSSADSCLDASTIPLSSACFGDAQGVSRRNEPSGNP